MNKFSEKFKDLIGKTVVMTATTNKKFEHLIKDDEYGVIDFYEKDNQEMMCIIGLIDTSPIKSIKIDNDLIKVKTKDFEYEFKIVKKDIYHELVLAMMDNIVNAMKIMKKYIITFPESMSFFEVVDNPVLRKSAQSLAQQIVNYYQKKRFHTSNTLLNRLIKDSKVELKKDKSYNKDLPYEDLYKEIEKLIK